MKHKRPISTFKLVGTTFLVFCIFNASIMVAEFSITAMLDMLIHWQSMAIIAAGLAVAVSRNGIDNFREAIHRTKAYLKDFTREQYQESRKILINTSNTIWLFAVVGAVVNFIVYSNILTENTNDYFHAARFAILPILYAVFLANIVFLTLAAILERKELDLRLKGKCTNCSKEVEEGAEYCSSCNEPTDPLREMRKPKVRAKKETSQKVKNVILAMIIVLLAGVCGILFIVEKDSENAMGMLWLFCLVSYFIGLGNSRTMSFGIAKSRVVTSVVYFSLMCLIDAIGIHKSYGILEIIWGDAVIIFVISIFVGLFNPENVLFGKSKSRLLSVAVYIVLLLLFGTVCYLIEEHTSYDFQSNNANISSIENNATSPEY